MTIIDKVSWTHIKDRKVLFVRSKGKTAFYTPGGKREAGESDAQTLVREIKEELNVDLVPETIAYMETFKALADGKEDMMVEIKCYTAEHQGELKPSSEIDEMLWLASADAPRTTPTGELLLAWLKERDLID